MTLLSLPVSGGCSTSTKRFYDGPARPISEIARIDESPSVAISGVDGKTFGTWGHQLIEVEPGDHTLSLEYFGGYRNSVKPVVVSVTLVAGHTYVTDATVTAANRWTPRVIDAATKRDVPLRQGGEN